MSHIIQGRLEAVVAAREAVRSHCMTAKYDENDWYITVIYPDGYYPNGVRVSTKMGKCRALQKVLEVCERHWKDSLSMFRLDGAA